MVENMVRELYVVYELADGATAHSTGINEELNWNLVVIMHEVDSFGVYEAGQKPLDVFVELLQPVHRTCWWVVTEGVQHAVDEKPSWGGATLSNVKQLSQNDTEFK